jgi:folate-binding protein YgfZ
LGGAISYCVVLFDWFSMMSAGLRFRRILVTGRDRARFLHNFCTNVVRDLPAGRSVEAFFVDVKARVLAHGYVLALPSRHEIHVLGVAGAEAALVKHLDRYIITEDVQVRSVPEEQQGQLWLSTDGGLDRCAVGCVELAGEGVRHVFRWTGGMLCVLAGEAQVVAAEVADLASWAAAATDEQLLGWRIAERFPVVGPDVSAEQLAPEVDRNSEAISYQKGCYLGQEPIARLDAMGHINRALRKVVLSGVDAADGQAWTGAELRSAEGAVLGRLTSVLVSAGREAGAGMGLAVVRLAGIPVEAVRGDGVRCVVERVVGRDMLSGAGEAG